ncbi:hypothetical protein CPB83DRAFT_833315 [Crepidotus variabilis]|uniref:Uncharacterized protein n=1 Tax=Crepidotus variabilis TaxID=179855 RepID=A0A9P6EM83_9AGAR|nr:hypothetical protein CPB83DRAFT_833315 [Crepidotus variabilis]
MTSSQGLASGRDFCGHPLCLRTSCNNLPYYPLRIYCANAARGPMNWLGRIVDGGFRLLDDNLLCHLINPTDAEFLLFKPGSKPQEWIPFDPATRITWEEGCIVILRDTKYPWIHCFGLSQLVAQVRQSFDPDCEGDTSGSESSEAEYPTIPETITFAKIDLTDSVDSGIDPKPKEEEERAEHDEEDDNDYMESMEVEDCEMTTEHFEVDNDPSLVEEVDWITDM